MELQEGRTGTTRDGRRVQVRNGRIVYIDAPTARGGQRAGASQFNKTLDTAAAKEVQQSRENASGSLSRISEAQGLINQLDSGGLQTGFMPNLQLGIMGGVGLNDKQVSGLRNLDRYGGTAAIESAAALKPLSNSDMQFLMSQQAGARERPDTNRTFLRARQWGDAKMMGKSAAQDAWIAKLGNPNATNAQGQSFNTWWASVENQFYPKPADGQRGSYIPPQRAQRPAQRPQAPAPARNRAPANRPRIISIEQVGN
jgi:hypothetical protein